MNQVIYGFQTALKNAERDLQDELAYSQLIEAERDRLREDIDRLKQRILEMGEDLREVLELVAGSGSVCFGGEI